MTWTVDHLPDLQPLTRMDEYLRQIATQTEVVREAISIANRALEDARAQEDRQVEARMLGYLTEAHRILGEPALAELYAREALALCEGCSDERRVVAARVRLGEVLRCQDRYEDAIREFRAALAVIDDRSTEEYRDFVLQHLGKTFMNAGRQDDAIVALREALRIRQRNAVPALVESTREAISYAVSGRGVRRSSFL